MQYTNVIERSPRNYAANASDLPGCIAAGVAREETVREMPRAIAFHIESLREHGEPLPEPRCTAAVVDVAAHRLIAGRRDSSEAGMGLSTIDTAVAGVKALRRRANGTCRLRHADGLERGGLGRPAVLRRHPQNELMMLGAAMATRLEAPRFGVRKS